MAVAEPLTARDEADSDFTGPARMPQRLPGLRDCGPGKLNIQPSHDSSGEFHGLLRLGHVMNNIDKKETRNLKGGTRLCIMIMIAPPCQWAGQHLPVTVTVTPRYGIMIGMTV